MKNVPWRMILVLALLVVVALFSGYNLETVNISIGFHVFTGVPLFLALIASFIAGTIVVVPFTILKKRTKRLPDGDGQASQANKPKRGRRRKGKKEEPEPQSSLGDRL